MPERRSGFCLRKYYLDCVADDGSACIGYHARLRWGPLSLAYAALLECDAAGVRREQQTFLRCRAPLPGSPIRWECPALHVAGTWQADAPVRARTLLDDERGRIRWEGLAPRARAEVRLDAGRVLRGRGYVERLELTIPPWRLPFDTLHWGRFHSDTDVLVWIAWLGETNASYVLHNGRELNAAEFRDDGARFGELELAFTETRVIHDAPIVSALAGLPRVLQRIPPAFALAKETKWTSRAELRRPGSPPTSGRTLHEIVTFR